MGAATATAAGATAGAASAGIGYGMVASSAASLTGFPILGIFVISYRDIMISAMDPRVGTE